MNRKSLIGIVEIVLGSLGFGFLGIFGKWAFANGLSVGELLTYRFTLAALLLWLGLFIFQRSKIRTTRGQVLISAALGIFGYALFASLYFTAIHGMSVGLAALLLYTYPFWVSILGHFFLGEKMSRSQWLLLATAFLGVSCLLWGQFQVKNLWALAAGLGSAVTYAAYILFSARYQRSISPVTSSLYVISFAALALAIFHQPNLQFWNYLTPVQWQIVIGIATLSTILPITLILSGLQKLKSSQAALITMLEPVTAAIAAGLLLSETLSALQIFGAFLVIASLTFSISRAK